MIRLALFTIGALALIATAMALSGGEHTRSPWETERAGELWTEHYAQCIRSGQHHDCDAYATERTMADLDQLIP